MNPRDKLILEKIVGYCRRIHDYLDSYHFDRDTFFNTPLLQDACAMCLVQIG